MSAFLRISLYSAAALLLPAVTYLLAWPVAVDPKPWQAPAAPDYGGDYRVNHALAQYTALDMAGTTGPEGVLVDDRGVVYATTDQGWIVRWLPGSVNAVRWVKMPGRPLGLAQGEGGVLWVADAFEGLYKVTPDGVIENVVSQVPDEGEPTPILYANDVTVANGKVYFTDSTRRFGAKAFNSTYKASLADILEHGSTGRLLEYDPASGTARVIMRGLSFANGVAADPGGKFLLINETAAYRVWRYELQGLAAGTARVIIDNLPGFPDNILAGRQGRFWLGFTSPRLPIVDKLADKPFVRKMVERLPAFLRPGAKHYGHVLAISGEGEVLANLQDPDAAYPLTTGAFETDEYLYVSSLIAPYLARMDKTAVEAFLAP